MVSIKPLDDQKVEKDSVVLITEDLKLSELSEKAIQDTTLEKSTPDVKQEDKNIDAKDSVSTDVKDDKSSLADVKLTDLPEKALTTTQEFKEYTDTKLPTDLSGKSDPDLKSATKDSGPDIVLDTRTDKKISESVIKPLDLKAELADHQTNDRAADKELVEDDTKSSVVSRKSSHDLISDIKTDVKEKEFKEEKEAIESLQKDKLSDEKTDTKDSKAVKKN
ncbi:hypothetical protein NQ314_003856 [Rhamnusium bicolor]|uniref:Uncharacterized protein n=1 Tax=Rhamnusium bicolor TaxID=1586634 RepID=A0AAV8ZMP1_9CUCU|nr:hypothetical protein NQ314_003856 [Rhamnusium bicolor]